MTFIEAIKEKAKKDIKTIILPESEDLRVLEGASKVLKEGFAKIILIKEEAAMKKYVCEVCGWVYDEEAGAPEQGIAPGTKFEDLPEDFVCPLCGVGKDQFSEE